MVLRDVAAILTDLAVIICCVVTSPQVTWKPGLWKLGLFIALCLICSRACCVCFIPKKVLFSPICVIDIAFLTCSLLGLPFICILIACLLSVVWVYPWLEPAFIRILYSFFRAESHFCSAFIRVFLSSVVSSTIWRAKLSSPYLLKALISGSWLWLTLLAGCW